MQEDADRAYFCAVDAFNGGERAQLVRDSVFGALFALIDRVGSRWTAQIR